MASFAFFRYSSASFILATLAAPLNVVVTMVLFRSGEDDAAGTHDFEASSLVDCTFVGLTDLEIAVTLRCDSVEPNTAEEEAGNPPLTLLLLMAGEASPNNAARLSLTLDL